MKLLFVMDSLGTGGIQTSLVNLLNRIDYSRFEVDLYLFHYEEGYRKRIPENVRILRGSKLLQIAGASAKEAKKMGAVPYLARMQLSIMCRLFGADAVYGVLLYMAKKLGPYDCAIAYSNNITMRGTYFGINKHVLRNVQAERKISWLHVDYRAMGLDCRINRKEYEMFDAIVCVSKAARDAFLGCCPEFREKTFVMYNLADKDRVLSLSRKKLPVRISGGKKNIITAARLDRNKNQADCLRAAAWLKKKGVPFHWYFAGDGPEKKMLEKMAAALSLGQEVTFLGNVQNPYPLMRACDIFVSASLSESYPLSIAEALLLSLPSVVHEYPAVDELIKNGNGVVTHGLKSMCRELHRLLTDDAYYERRRLAAYLDVDDDRNLQVFYSLAGGLDVRKAL